MKFISDIGYAYSVKSVNSLAPYITDSVKQYRDGLIYVNTVDEDNRHRCYFFDADAGKPLSEPIYDVIQAKDCIYYNGKPQKMIVGMKPNGWDVLFYDGTIIPLRDFESTSDMYFDKWYGSKTPMAAAG